MEHLGEGDFEGFWDDRLEPAGMQRILRHLVSDCSSCRTRLLASAPTPFWKLERLPDDAYDAPIERAWRAESLLDRGTGELVIQAHLYGLESSLRRAQRQIDRALKLLDQACRIYRRPSRVNSVRPARSC